MTSRKYLLRLSVAVLALVTPLTALSNTNRREPAVSVDRESRRWSDSATLSNYALNQDARWLAYKSQTFQRTLEHELNRSYLDGTLREQRANQLSADFHLAAENLYSQYAMGNTVKTSRAEADKLFQLTEDLDEFLSRTPVSRSTLKVWDDMKCELSTLAAAYDLDEDNGEQETAYHSAALSHGRIWSWL